MQYTSLEDAWAPKARFGPKPVDCKKFDKSPRNDTAARRQWAPSEAVAHVPTSCDSPAFSDSISPSDVKRFLANVYMTHGPQQFMKLMPSSFVDSVTKWGSKCPPAGEMYTRRGVFNKNTLAVDDDDVQMPGTQRVGDAQRMRQRRRTTKHYDDSMVNIVLYAVTLGMVALIVIDTILRFRK